MAVTNADQSSGAFREFAPDPDRAFAIARELLSIPSFKGEEAELAAWANARLTEMGFETELQTLRPGQAQVIATSHVSDSRPTLMLNGHLDIDPLRSNWTTDPFEARLEGNLLIGAGARNMQGGLVSILLAAEALVNQRDRANLTIALVAGELQGGLGTTHALERGLSADLAIVPEPFGVDNLVTDTWGVIEFAIVVQGLSDHISKLHLAKNPLPVAIDLRAALLERVADRFGSGETAKLLFNIGGFIAGRGDEYSFNAANYSPDRAALLIDVRHTVDISSEDVMRFFDEIVAEAAADAADAGISVALQSGSTDMYRLNEINFPAYNANLPAELEQYLNDRRRESLGEPFAQSGTVYPHSYCGADTSHMGNAGIPSVLVGPIGPAPTPGIGDDAVFFDEVLETATYMHEVACTLDWAALGRSQ
ncbi:Acetylornithine deacetylase [Agrococcus casei LMG 22410]|uniref:Acetylornithine deacetylase n=1 Tax=Agrococcus casei LMG 22410 TaxID=1255656 RepID=A0A1R4ERV1_9MICO|nr:Acetylornithine deacetylase [Agrococcus casei LMG 22410]